MAGRAAIDVLPEVLSILLASLPKSYQVAGSDLSSYDGCVRLILESTDIADGTEDLVVSCIIEDAGSTRTVRMVPS